MKKELFRYHVLRKGLFKNIKGIMIRMQPDVGKENFSLSFIKKKITIQVLVFMFYVSFPALKVRLQSGTAIHVVVCCCCSFPSE